MLSKEESVAQLNVTTDLFLHVQKLIVGMNELLKGQTRLVFHSLMLGDVLLLHTMHQTKQKLIK